MSEPFPDWDATKDVEDESISVNGGVWKQQVSSEGYVTRTRVADPRWPGYQDQHRFDHEYDPAHPERGGRLPREEYPGLYAAAEGLADPGQSKWEGVPDLRERFDVDKAVEAIGVPTARPRGVFRPEDPHDVVFDALRTAWQSSMGIQRWPEEHVEAFTQAVIASLDEYAKAVITQYVSTKEMPVMKVESPEDLRPFLTRYAREQQIIALNEAADAIQALHPGETKASVTFLRERVAGIEAS